jgi:precorrin-6B methylase 2
MPVSPESLLARFENAGLLLGPDSLAERFDLLDQLELHFPQVGSRAQALRARLEAANIELFQSIRLEILRGACPALFAQELLTPAAQPAGDHYDHLDELLAGVFAFPAPKIAPEHAEAPTDAEQVSFQPTPARHIFALIREAHLTTSDTLIDLGSGLGHVPLLVSACTGARAIGIEIEPAYVASARRSAEALHLERTNFQAQDARSADLSSGTVFYLYTPFTGSILRTVLDHLRAEAGQRAIRICTFGPCATTVAREEWLAPATEPAEDRITVFKSSS